ncbi:MAG TPA: outer membrane beta-barrel protein [Vicinamibacterales bacterium]|nr:outer membrane beta-barrel protein [Vicinamibacterales bacterium]
MRLTKKILGAAAAIVVALEGPASAQAMFTGSIGNVFGGDAPSKKSVWAVALGGGGAHGIGSELEFSETRNFFETADGVSHGKIMTLMPSILVTVPVARIRPYGVFGFGFIRQRTDDSLGGLFSGLSDNDIGYNIGGGVIFKFASHAGVRADLRRFKVRKADGLSFNRFLVGLVLGG